jgi:hypothetical protein
MYVALTFKSLTEISSNPCEFFDFNALIIEVISLVVNVLITKDGGG